MFAAKYQSWKPEVPSAFSGCDPFNVSIPIQPGFAGHERRFLIVFEHVDTQDLRTRHMLGRESTSANWFDSAIELGLDYAKHLKPSKPAFAAVNFNFFKTYDLPPNEQAEANNYSAERVHALIEKINPTDIVVFGDVAAAALLPKVDQRRLLLRRGRPIKRGGRYWTNTISLSRAYQGRRASMEDEEDENESAFDHANLLGFVGRCMGNALMRKIVYKIEVEAKVRLVNSIEVFRKLLKKLLASDRVAVDTETSGLGRAVNKLLTIQFAFSQNQAYVVPVDHRDAPWTVEEKAEVVAGLRKFFTRKFDPLDKTYDKYLLGQNLKFDLTIVRQRLQIHVITWRVWDLMAGEYVLDENMKALLKCRLPLSGKVSPYSLDWFCAWYGCDFYQENAFGKDDRHTIEQRSLSEEGLLEYCGMDVQVPWAIHDKQKLRAERTLIKNAPYGKRYAKFVVTQMNNLIQIESMMEHRGDHIDVPWLLKLKDRNGPMLTVYKDFDIEFRQSKAVHKVNKLLIAESGLPKTSIWSDSNGKAKVTWLFDVGKPDHKQKLFIDVLKLEPVSHGKTGVPKIDKFFQEAHKDVTEVGLFTQLSQIRSLKSNYVDGFYARLREDPDMKTDQRIRPSFGFTGTVTGRSNSYDPNLQNIPQRGKFAKYIKRLFTAPRGCLILKMDYSSHEVRMWGIIANDELLCELFVNGRWLRQMYRKTGNKVYLDLMDTKGDIHKINCEFFFKVEAKDVTKEQRNAVKAIVFGAIYGRGAKAIAEAAKAKVEEIKIVLEKFFKRFPKASGWLAMAKKHAVTHGYMYSPIWRVRNMFTNLYGIDNFDAGTERRGCNAPVQGFAADIGHTAALLYEVHVEQVVRKFKLDKAKILKAGVNTFVHDAIKTDAPYEYLLVCLQVLQWCATIGVMGYYENHWGIKFPVEIEVEFELAAHDAEHWKWNWHEGDTPTLDKGEVVGGGLQFILRKALTDQKEVYPDLDIEATLKTIYKVRENKELTAYLDEHYPILDDWHTAKHIDTKSQDFKRGLGKMIQEAKAKAAADEQAVVDAKVKPKTKQKETA